MSCGRLTPEIQKSLTAVSASQAQVEFFTDWLPCTGIDMAHVVMQIRNLTGDFGARPCFQIASVTPNKPDAPAAFVGVSYYVADGATFDLQNLASITNGEFLIRFGVQYMIQDTDVGTADVSLQVSYGAKGQMRGKFSKDLVALNDTLEHREILTDWIPALQVSKFNIAYLSNADAEFQYKFAYQTAEATIDSPGPWTGTSSWFAGDQERNLGDQSPTTTGKMWIRIGVFYKCTATNTNAQGYLTTVVASRG